MSHAWSSVTLVLIQWAQEQRGRGDKKGGCASVPHPGLPFTKTDVATAVAECLTCKQQWSTQNTMYPPYNIISEETKQPLGNKLITLDAFPSGGNSVSSLLGQRFVLAMGGFAFPHLLASCLRVQSNWSASVRSQRDSLGSRVRQWANDHRTRWFNHIPHHHTVLKSQLRCLQGWDTIF